MRAQAHLSRTTTFDFKRPIVKSRPDFHWRKQQDEKLNLPNTATRQEVLAAMEGKVVGKSVFVGRFRGMPAQ
jgi:hypothetical protein